MKSISKSMILNMAIRNIIRNKRRSLLSASTIFIVIIILCVISSLISAQNADRITNVINHVSGNIRVRNQLFSDNERITPLQFYISQTAELLTYIKAQKGVAGAEPHIGIGTIVDPNGDQVATSLIGLNFETSRIFSDSNTEIISGKIPSSNDKNVVVITPFMANRFNLEVGDKFTFRTSTAIGQNAVTVKVNGIVETANSDFLGLTFFMDWQQLSDKLRTNGNALEILVHTDEELSSDETEKLISTIQNYVNTSTPLEVKKWNEVGVVAQLNKDAESITMFLSFFFVLMSSTIILNSTMMAVLERKKEIGALMSLGMEAKHIKNLFLLESALLAFMASLASVIVAFIGVTIWGNIGIEVPPGVSGGSMSTWLYPSLDFGGYLFFFLLGTSIATIACIIPARLALKIQPSEALRSSE